MKKILTLISMISGMLFCASSEAQTSEMALVHHPHHMTKTAPHPSSPSAKLDLVAGLHAASFPGLADYLATHLTYPDLAREHGVEGTLTLEMHISREGDVIDAYVVHSLGFGCDDAALRVVRSMPSWNPATNHGIPVKSKARLDIDFHLH